ncbi:MAG: hypothetical protein K5634_07730 [Sphaerochaetaceae bacterium]|nr:hypothetical protein [Sphaerochaetaceae bacterium]
MKKLIITTIILVSVFSAFAYPLDMNGTPFNSLEKAFIPTDASFSNYITYALFKDPTVIGEGKFCVVFPSVSLTHYNTASFLSTEAGAKFASRILKLQLDNLNWIPALYAEASSLGVGYNDLATLDLGFGVSDTNWVLGVNSRFLLDCYSPSGAGTDGQFRPQADLAASFAFNVNLLDRDNLSMDFAIVTRFAYRTYTTSDIELSVVQDFDFDSIGFTAGWAVPIDVALGFSILDDLIGITASVTNINGIYYTMDYDNFKKSITMQDGSNSDTLETPVEVNLLLEYDPKLKYVDPKLRIELTDLYRLSERLLIDDPYEEIMAHVNAIVSLDVLGLVDLSVGLNAGYWQFESAFDVAGNSISLLYGWHEASTQLGYKPVDSLTLRVTLGYDGN